MRKKMGIGDLRGLDRSVRRICGLGAAAAVFAAAALPQETAAPRQLRAGKAIERRLAGGEAHAYFVDARPGARLLVTVEQRGIDVAVEAARAEQLLAVDGPLDSEGPESLLLPPEMVGTVEIRVLSPSPGAAPGTYAIRLEEIGEGSEAERGRVEAERLLTEAGAANRREGAEDKRQAAALYEQAGLRWRALGRGSDEARCALARGGIALALGEPTAALDRFSEALDRFAALGDEGGQAAAWSGLGLARTAAGDTSGAAEAQRRALDLERRLGRTYEQAKALNNLGFALHSGGSLREALVVYGQALDAFAAAGETGSWKANVLHNLAAVYHGLGEPAAALAADREVLALWRALGDRRGEARTLNNLGALYNDLGDFGRALDAYTPALALFQASGDRLWEASVLRNRGAAYYGLGDLSRALEDLEGALAIRRAAGDAKGAAAAEVAVGYARLQAGEVGPALDLGRRSAAAANAASDRRGELLARLLSGKASLAAGEAEAALADLGPALDLARQIEDRIDEAAVHQLLGAAQLALGRAEPASRSFDAALDLARTVQSPVRSIEALVGLARAERKLGRPETARGRLDEALGLIETLRASESDPDLRASYLAAQRAAFEMAIDLAMAAREPAAGLEIAERSRARSLLDLLQESRADIREGIDPALRERERDLLVRLNAKAGRRAELSSRPAGEERRRAAEVEVRAAIDELAALDAEIRAKSPHYAELTRPRPATAAEIQALLADGSLLLEVSLGEERSFLWAVDAESVAGFTLPPRAEVEAAARAVYERLSVLGGEGENLDRAAARLSAMLLGPVAARLGERRLIVVLDGELQYVPFAALPIPDAGAAEGGRPIPLLARHEVADALSASSVVLARRLGRRVPAPGAVAVLADPVFGPDDPRVRRSPEGAAAAGSNLRAPAPREADAFARLPWTRREAEAIAAIAATPAIPPRGRSLLALDFEANRATALSPEIARYRIVHFATHGVIDAATPALSGLMLSRVDERGAPEEGFLGLPDVYNLRLGADLVVLSGCETALGQKVRGEGLVGLTRGFLYGGARQVLASLWRVEDRATAELMSRFYRGLLAEGLTPAAALRKAQLGVRAEARWRSPYYWSGFVLQGDWAGS
ncbi:MAG TPA: CHAT domain-containing tetratricopeptide repeat protein [Thermoanaerobaculia bacterium]|nr:CHAT domain-containing tetratricopeptide repeat protein [Thermoanaerobaculia bacterium]